MERYRTTLILLGVLVVLALVAFFVNLNPSSTVGVPTPVPETDIWNEPNQVIGIDVISATQRVSVHKDVTTTIWTLTEPLKHDADPFVVGNIADILQKPIATSVLTNPGDLAQYHLDKPSFSVEATFSDTQHTKHSLLIGGPTFDGSNYYTKLPGSTTVYAISNSTVDPLRSWLTTPPVLQPTATPLPITVVPTETLTTTTTVTSTLVPEASPSGTSAITTTSTISGTSSISGTTSITVTSPGAANPTTPVASPPLGPTATP
jgi:hypothetical protein